MKLIGNNLLKNKKGYTLVELIITLVVIGIMIVPIFNAFTESHRVNLLSEREVSGAYVAQNVMEELKQSDHSTLAAITTAPITDASRTFTRSSGGTDFTVQVTVTDVTSSLGIGLDTTVIDLDSLPTADVEVHLPAQGQVGSIDYADAGQGSYVLDDTNRNIVIRFNDSGIRYQLSTPGHVGVFTELDASKLQMNIYGPASGTLLDWDIEIVNSSALPLYITKVDDADRHIQVGLKSDELSDSDVWISSSMPPVVGSVRQAKSWYNVLVQVSYDSITFETLESTIGK